MYASTSVAALDSVKVSPTAMHAVGDGHEIPVSAEWFADNNPADNSGLLVLRAATDRPGAELEIDVDDLSGSNNTSIDLPQPAGGWKTSITEAEYLCFYDATSWPLSHRQPGKAVTLPAGCGA